MGKRRVSTDDHRLMVSAYRLGASQVEIAARWGCSQPTVARILKAHHIDRFDQVNPWKTCNR